MTTAGARQRAKDYYDILGVSRTATDKEIKAAYRRLARKYHPDVSKEPDAEVRFKEMKEAYDVLKNTEKRAAYDSFGANWQRGPEFRPPPGWQQHASFDDTRFDDIRFDGAEPFDSIFEEIFGRGGASRRGFSRGFRTQRRDGDDIHGKVRITLEDAFAGATRQFSVDVPATDASGRPAYNSRKLNVRIPKGVLPGQKIRLANQGAAGTGSGAADGDLLLEVDIAPHRMFRLEGRDIHVDVPVSPSEAALGRTVKVPTLGGQVDLKVPAGSSSGKKLRLKGRGLPGSPAGDQYVHLQIALPHDIGAKARELYEALERVQKFDPRKNLR